MTYKEMLDQSIKEKREEIEMLRMAAATYEKLKEKEAYIHLLLMNPEYYEEERARATMEAREHAQHVVYR